MSKRLSDEQEKVVNQLDAYISAFDYSKNETKIIRLDSNSFKIFKNMSYRYWLPIIGDKYRGFLVVQQ